MAAVAAPGVFVQEINKLPPAIVEVASAVPAFVGFTAFDPTTGRPQQDRATLVRSMTEFEQLFGAARPEAVTSITFDAVWGVKSATFDSPYHLHESMRLFFANGGARCFVVSAGMFRGDGAVDSAQLLAALAAAAAVDDVTLLVVPDAVTLARKPRAEIQRAMLQQAGTRRDRFALLDLAETPDGKSAVSEFRDDIGTTNFSFGAAYTPWLRSRVSREFRYREISAHLKEFQRAQPHGVQTLFVQLDAAIASGDSASEERLEQQLRATSAAYAGIIASLVELGRPVPPSGAVAGIYAQVDSARGVWNAPADVAVAGISGLTRAISKTEQDSLNVDPTAGKSIDAIRMFAGRGHLVFGARTLAGNDNEWRYIPVRRLAMVIEESVGKGCQWAVFEPNDEPLWAQLRASITNYLTTLWRRGAFQGAKPQEAFFVHIGRGITMTDADIAEGRLNIEIGIAPVRPAEFIILKLSLKMAAR